jgi:hypothetical protein
MRLSLDCQASVKLGDDSRGGKTRGENQAADPERGCEEQPVPFGIVAAARGQWQLTVGSAFKTRDFIGDSLPDGGKDTPVELRAQLTPLPLKVDHGPERSGVRTPFLKRMVEVADDTGKSIHLLDYLPYPSKYKPIERGGGLLEQHGNGAQRVATEAMLEGANSMTWRGIQPVVKLSSMIYRKGIALSQTARRDIEARLERNPLLPKGDILIRPA